MTHRSKRVFSASLLVVLSSLVAVAIAAAQPADMRGQLAQSVAALKAKALANPRGSVRVIARLSEAAVSRSRQSTLPARNAPGAYVPAALRTPPAFIRSAQDLLLRRMTGLGVKSAKRIEGVPMVALTVNSAQLDALMSSGEVAIIFEDEIVQPTLDVSGPLIGADVAQNLGARGAGTTIAILDTGVMAAHQYFGGRVLNGACFSTNDDNLFVEDVRSFCPGGAESSTAVNSAEPCFVNGCDHGTHVAGIAAGRNAPAFVSNGVAPDAKVLPVQVFSHILRSNPDQQLGSFASDLVAALQYVRQRAPIDNIVAVNMSLGDTSKYKSGCDFFTDKYGRPIFRLPVAEMVHALREMGIATVFSSGNASFNDGVGFPGCTSEAITVGASDDNDAISDFSNHGALVDVMAPGVGIKSSINPAANGFASYSGTSMAAPHVAGAIAVIRSKVAMSVDQMVGLLQSTGDPVSGARNSPARVRINIGRAMEQVAPSGQPTVEIDRRRLIRSSTGRCLDAHGPTAGQNGGRVQVWSCHGKPNQLWIAHTNGALRNEAAGLCLDVHGPDIAKNRGRVQVWSCNTSPRQRWTVVPASKTIKISSGLCLDAHADEQFADGGTVMIFGCHGKSNQEWTFISPDVLAREANVRTGAGLCLDVHAPEVATKGGRVQVWTCNNKAQQQWTHEPNSKAIRLASGLCLDAHLPQITTKGGRVQVWACNGQIQQQWTPQPNGALRNGGGLCLDVHAPDQNKNGGRVQIWPCNGGQQQRFTSKVFDPPMPHGDNR